MIYNLILISRLSIDKILLVDNRRFQVNTVYLSAYSPVFERMFQIDMVEKHAKEVEIRDVKAEHFEDFLAAISPQRIQPNRCFEFMNNFISFNNLTIFSNQPKIKTEKLI